MSASVINLCTRALVHTSAVNKCFVHWLDPILKGSRDKNSTRDGVFTARDYTQREWLHESGYRLTLIDVVASQLQIETTNFAVCVSILTRYFPVSSRTPIPPPPPLPPPASITDNLFSPRLAIFPASIFAYNRFITNYPENLSFDSPSDLRYSRYRIAFDHRRSFPARRCRGCGSRYRPLIRNSIYFQLDIKRQWINVLAQKARACDSSGNYRPTWNARRILITRDIAYPSPCSSASSWQWLEFKPRARD